MPKDNWIYVEHMLDKSRKAVELSAGSDKINYDQDETLRLALTHLVQVIGEAALHISPEFRDSYPQVPWREIIGMRHRIVHDYLDVDEDIVWQVIHLDLPNLIRELERIPPGKASSDKA